MICDTNQTGDVKKNDACDAMSLNVNRRQIIQSDVLCKNGVSNRDVTGRDASDIMRHDVGRGNGFRRDVIQASDIASRTRATLQTPTIRKYVAQTLGLNPEDPELTRDVRIKLARHMPSLVNGNQLAFNSVYDSQSEFDTGKNTQLRKRTADTQLMTSSRRYSLPSTDAQMRNIVSSTRTVEPWTGVPVSIDARNVNNGECRPSLNGSEDVLDIAADRCAKDGAAATVARHTVTPVVPISTPRATNSATSATSITSIDNDKSTTSTTAVTVENSEKNGYYNSYIPIIRSIDNIGNGATECSVAQDNEEVWKLLRPPSDDTSSSSKQLRSLTSATTCSSSFSAYLSSCSSRSSSSSAFLFSTSADPVCVFGLQDGGNPISKFPRVSENTAVPFKIPSFHEFKTMRSKEPSGLTSTQTAADQDHCYSKITRGAAPGAGVSRAAVGPTALAAANRAAVAAAVSVGGASSSAVAPAATPAAVGAAASFAANPGANCVAAVAGMSASSLFSSRMSCGFGLRYSTKVVGIPEAQTEEEEEQEENEEEEDGEQRLDLCTLNLEELSEISGEDKEEPQASMQEEEPELQMGGVGATRQWKEKQVMRKEGVGINGGLQSGGEILIDGENDIKKGLERFERISDRLCDIGEMLSSTNCYSVTNENPILSTNEMPDRETTKNKHYLTNRQDEAQKNSGNSEYEHPTSGLDDFRSPNQSDSSITSPSITNERDLTGFKFWSGVDRVLVLKQQARHSRQSSAHSGQHEQSDNKADKTNLGYLVNSSDLSRKKIENGKPPSGARQSMTASVGSVSLKDSNVAKMVAMLSQAQSETFSNSLDGRNRNKIAAILSHAQSETFSNSLDGRKRKLRKDSEGEDEFQTSTSSDEIPKLGKGDFDNSLDVSENSDGFRSDASEDSSGPETCRYNPGIWDFLAGETLANQNVRCNGGERIVLTKQDERTITTDDEDLSKSSDGQGCEDCGRMFDLHELVLVEGHGVCRKCKSKMAERRRAVQEIIETEISYGNDLSVIKKEFYEPLRSNGLLSEDQLEIIFLNIAELLTISEYFSHRLKIAAATAFIDHQRSENVSQGEKPVYGLTDISDEKRGVVCEIRPIRSVNGGMIDGVGQAFLESANMLMAFETYCISQSGSSILVDQLVQERELVKIFLDELQKENVALRKMDLKSFLMLPVQRVMKYPLLLDRLIKVTPSYDEDRENLRLAKKRIEDTLALINSKAVGSLRVRRGSAMPWLGAKKNVLGFENLEITQVAMDQLKWTRNETYVVKVGRLAHIRSSKNQILHCVIATLGMMPNYGTMSDKRLVFPQRSTLRGAAFVMIKEKAGKFFPVREPLFLDRCIVAMIDESSNVFDVHEMMKDSVILKAEEDRDSKEGWFWTLRMITKDLGQWRKRRNALANAMTHRRTNEQTNERTYTATTT